VSPAVAPVEALAADLLDRAAGRDRYLFAIAGPPGSGKSTLAAALLAALEARAPGAAALVPMDGYHFDNAVLAARGHRPRKGAPFTFDVDGLARDLARIREGGREVAVPVFDRTLDLARASARIVPPGAPLILVEGNYLLLDEPPWDALANRFDRTLLIEVDEAELARRLVGRWLGYGLGIEGAWLRAESNDLPNARLVVARSRRPDVRWTVPPGG
jgi:pantothenate kinase